MRLTVAFPGRVVYGTVHRRLGARPCLREHADDIREKYLDHTHDDQYKMKPEYDTQRKVEAAFEGKTSSADVWIRDGLYALISDVLFVRDRKDSK